MDNVISVRNLTQRYGRGRLIYEGLSFDVPKGSILGLLGKNGTGKTTTINISWDSSVRRVGNAA